MQSTNNDTNQVPKEGIPMNTVHEVMDVLHDWHTKRCSNVVNMMQVPEGTMLIVADENKVEDDVELNLSGDVHKAFILGLKTAMSQLGQLPFQVVVPEDGPAEEQQPPTPQ